VLADLAVRNAPVDRAKSCHWFESVFRCSDPEDLLDVRPREEKDRLFAYKEQVWSGFGYGHSYLAQMQSQSFWDAQFDAVDRVDRDLAAARRS
jgi:hypothetical protein